jgi:hypothetical protein
VGDAGTKVDAAVRGATDAAKARVVTDATRAAWNRNRDLAAAVAAGDRAAITRARLDIQNALATALGDAATLARAQSAAASDLQAGVRSAVAALAPSARDGWWTAGKIAAATALGAAAAGGMVAFLATRPKHRYAT